MVTRLEEQLGLDTRAAIEDFDRIIGQLGRASNAIPIEQETPAELAKLSRWSFSLHLPE
jgi:hypothetical protein